MRIHPKLLRDYIKLYFILGTTNCKKDPKVILTEAIDGGITCFQFREKGAEALMGEDKIKLALELQYLCKKSSIPFIINDDVDLAIAINADGVHIGQEDGSAELIRERIKDKILGISVHNLEEARMAVKAGADYFGVGPIFPTKTKEDAQAVQGIKIIQELRNNGITLPIVGIGGITTEKAASVMKAGGDGVSVISAISQAEDIKKAAEMLKNEVIRNKEWNQDDE